MRTNLLLSGFASSGILPQKAKVKPGIEDVDTWFFILARGRTKLERRVVITGVGVIASNGIGKDAFWEAVREGRSGIKPVTLFNTSSTRSKQAGQISDFDPTEFLGTKGLRTLDRSTKLINSAAKMALDDADLQITDEMTSEVGVAIGTTLGNLDSISDFDRESLIEGPRFVNPAMFPNTVFNSPASHISIRQKIKGFNTTISTGFSASLDALSYAIDFLRLGRVRAVLAGGVEGLSIQTFLGFYKIGYLAGSKGERIELSCPFDKRRNGIVLGEGAAVLVLEDLHYALEGGARIYAEVSGFGTAFDAFKMNRYNPRAEGAKRAMRLALEDAELGPGDIDYISSTANSTLDCDVMETRAIKDVFRERLNELPISSIKSMIGECFSASGAMQVAASVGVINDGTIPPTINYEEKDRRCDLDYVPNEPRKQDVSRIMINSFGPSGSNSSLIISRCRDLG